MNRNTRKSVIAAGGGARLGPELVTNGNMETGSPPTGWGAGGDSPILTSAADERTGGIGTKSLDIAIGVGQATGTVTQDVVLVAGHRYRYSAWIKNVDTSYIAAIVYTNGGSTMVLFDGQIQTAWSHLTQDFACTEDGYLVFLAVGSAGKNCRIDDVSVKEIL